MNLSYLKYAVEVEKTGSITRAAQNFYMNQPHLSKIIRELERDLGSPIFDRTSRGMVPTRRGEEFLRYAKAILIQEEQIDALCSRNRERSLDISLCGPRASYSSMAFAAFLQSAASSSPLSSRYREAGSRETIQAVSSRQFDLGIIRCQSLYLPYQQKQLQEENLTWTELWHFPASVLMSASHPLAERESLTYLDLAGWIEIVQDDTPSPSFSFDSPAAASGKEPLSPHTVSVCDRASQYDLLRQLSGSYCWCSPVPYTLLSAHRLVQKPCSYPGNSHQDLLIYRSGHRLSPEENSFLCHLYRMISQLSE